MGVRRLDGSFKTIGVWTNPLKRYVIDERFLHGSLEPLDEFFARYLRQGESDDAFGGSQDTTPGECGFVLIDEIERIVVNWSHYSRLCFFRLDEFGSELGRDVQSFEFSEDEDSLKLRSCLRKLVSGALVYDPVALMHADMCLSGRIETDQDLADFISSLPMETVKAGGRTIIRSTSGIRLKIACPSWQFIELDHFSNDDLRLARAHVERCVKLTDVEKAA